MPDLIKLYIRNVIIGFAVAAVFVGGLLWFNVMNLWHLVTHSDAGFVAVLVMWVLHGIVFAGVQFGWAVMAMAEKPGGPRRGTPVRAHEMRPAPVPATANAPDRRARR
ncbi:MAG TPA: hypothetical protein DEA05_12475 [Rhodobacteraceae bacterium]|nr:hypothetical protein [Paracoccaceae bacterium]